MKLTLSKLSQFSIVLIGLVSLYLILDTFETFLRPLSIALLFTFLTINFYRYDRKKKFLKLGYFSFFALLIVVLVSTLLSAQDTTLQDEVNLNNSSIDENFETTNSSSNIAFIQNLENDYGHILDNSFVSTQDLNQLAQQALSVIFNSISVFLSELLLVIIFYIFIIPSYDIALKYLQKTYFNHNHKEFQSAILEIEQGIKSYLNIKILVSFGTAILSGVIMFIFGVNNILLLSIVIFALNFIPNVGSIIAVFIITILYFIQVGLGLPLVMLLILLGAVQLLFGNYIEPKISGKGLNMPPILILLSLFFWGTLWGVGGMLISVPLTHAIKTIVEKLSEINE